MGVAEWLWLREEREMRWSGMGAAWVRRDLQKCYRRRESLADADSRPPQRRLFVYNP
jgi:hypothetical protein